MRDVSRETLTRVERLLETLLTWNARINLVGPGTLAQWRARHIDDSLQLLPMLPPGDGPIGDLGTGAGFPGLVLAAAQPRPIHLVESDQRKCAFLREAIRALDLQNVTVHATRIERADLPPLSVVTARALAPLDALVGYAARLLAHDGVAIFPKGRNAEAELTAAAAHWQMATERFPSGTDPEATIFRIRNIRPV